MSFKALVGTVAIGTPVATVIIAAVGFMGTPPHPGVGWGFVFLTILVLVIEATAFVLSNR